MSVWSLSYRRRNGILMSCRRVSTKTTHVCIRVLERKHISRTCKTRFLEREKSRILMNFTQWTSFVFYMLDYFLNCNRITSFNYRVELQWLLSIGLLTLSDSAVLNYICHFFFFFLSHDHHGSLGLATNIYIILITFYLHPWFSPEAMIMDHLCL